MKKILLAGGIVAVVLVFAGRQTSRASYESAPYEVVQKDGEFEVRDYPALTVAETAMTGTGDGSDGSFNRLFGFISGRNEPQQKIAMTTPVFMSGDSQRTMAFVLPKSIKADEAPRPADSTVTIRTLPAGRFAVLRFGGRRHSKLETETLARLTTWMDSQGLKVLSPPVYGYFDPPWTPGFMRRNEVMLRTEPKK